MVDVTSADGLRIERLEQQVRDRDAEIRRLAVAHDAAFQALRDEMDAGLRLRELGGARPDENITEMTERVIRERDELRILIQRVAKYPDNVCYAGTLLRADVMRAAGPPETWKA